MSNLKNSVSSLSSETSKINLYVGSDGKLHWVNKAGADSALNFSSVKSLSLIKETTTGDGNQTLTISASPGLYVMFGCSVSRGNSGESTGSFSCSGGTVVKTASFSPNSNTGIAQVLYCFVDTTSELTFYKSNANGYSSGYMGIFKCT